MYVLRNGSIERVCLSLIIPFPSCYKNIVVLKRGGLLLEVHFPPASKNVVLKVFVVLFYLLVGPHRVLFPQPVTWK
jgi:hypothetical protein